MRRFCVFISLVLILSGCGDQEKTAHQINEIPLDDTTKTLPVVFAELADSLVLTGSIIQGDFNGDGKTEEASTRITSEAIFQEKAYGFELFFSDQIIASLFGETSSSSDTTIYLINEGNLNDVPGHEITLYMPPLNGFTYDMQTYTFSNGKWKNFMEPVLVRTAFYEGHDIDLQTIIFIENDIVYYNDVDPNSSEFTLIRKRAVLKGSQ